jgi:HAD superfamily hydrolase (TIGR01484 family)
MSHFHLMPTCGTQYYRPGPNGIEKIYAHFLAQSEKQRILSVIREEAERLELWEDTPWGNILEDRGSQITFSALGQFAPLQAKVAWDPTGTKKSTLRAAVAARLPDLEVRSGGSTSIDVTHRGIDKAYGMGKLAEATGIALEDMLFIGDRLDADGNDYPVLAMGVACQAVDGWEDTASIIENLLRKTFHSVCCWGRSYLESLR